MHTYFLHQLQLSNTNSDRSKFILENDSNWNIAIDKISEIDRIDPSIKHTIIVPLREQCHTQPDKLIAEYRHGLENRVNFARIKIQTLAPLTRTDFNTDELVQALGDLKKYSHVFNNDPCLVGNYKAMFASRGADPFFIAINHFLDSPLGSIVSNPAFGYWTKTIDGAFKSNLYLNHSISMMEIFEKALRQTMSKEFADRIMAKTDYWKDSFSVRRAHEPCEDSKAYFSDDIKRLKSEGKIIVFIPNRIGDPDSPSRSLDYTNNGYFLKHILPQVTKNRRDFVVVCGNPTGKISHNEISKWVGIQYYSLRDEPISRHDYRWLSQNCDVVVGLYTDGDSDSNGGLALFESVTHKAMLFAPDVNEYKRYYDAINFPDELRLKNKLTKLIDADRAFNNFLNAFKDGRLTEYQIALKKHIDMLAYETTTPLFLNKLLKMS